MASANGLLDLVIILLKNNADLSKSNVSENTALHWACTTRQHEGLSYFIFIFSYVVLVIKELLSHCTLDHIVLGMLFFFDDMLKH